jgi:hypothetical protein
MAAQTFTFKSQNPGYVLTLFLDGQPVKRKNGKYNVVFVDTGPGYDRCGIFTTEEVNVAKAIEQSEAFKKGRVTRQKLQAELDQEQKVIDQGKALESLKRVSGMMEASKFDRMTDSELREVADQIGIKTATDDGKKRLKTQMASDIKLAIFGQPLSEYKKDLEANDPFRA